MGLLLELVERLAAFAAGLVDAQALGAVSFAAAVVSAAAVLEFLVVVGLGAGAFGQRHWLAAPVGPDQVEPVVVGVAPFGLVVGAELAALQAVDVAVAPVVFAEHFAGPLVAE